MSVNPTLRGRVVVKFPAQVVAGDGMTITKSGATYTFSTTGGPGGAVPEAPLDGQQYGRQNGAWTVIVSGGGPPGSGDFVKIPGDTMTGALEIKMADPHLHLTKTVDNQPAYIQGNRGTAAGAGMRWRMALGDTSQELGSNTGSDFRLQCYNDGGSILTIPLLIVRQTGKVIISGAPAAGGALMSVNKLAAGEASSIRGELNGAARWQMSLGDQTAETGGDVGSDFKLQCYSSTGSIICVPLYIERKTGKVSIAGIPGVGQPILSINKLSSGMASAIGGQTGASPRWQMALGDSNPESGGNTGSDFRLQAYSDAGAITTIPIYIERATGVIRLSANPPTGLPMVYINKLSGGGGQGATLGGTTAGALRWHIALGDSNGEGGGDSGSDFRLHRYHDDGSSIGPSIVISRASGDYISYTANTYKPGGGAWLDSSDARIKTVTGDYTKGLAEVRQIVPRTFTYLGNDVPPGVGTSAPGAPDPLSHHYQPAINGQQFIGMVAQEIEGIFPEMVTQKPMQIDGQLVNDLRILDRDSLIYALVNSVKELAARVEVLESRPGSRPGPSEHPVQDMIHAHMREAAQQAQTVHTESGSVHKPAPKKKPSPTRRRHW